MTTTTENPTFTGWITAKHEDVALTAHALADRSPAVRGLVTGHWTPRLAGSMFLERFWQLAPDDLR